ncbi:MAG: HEAT repeat domain-containing protein [Deltaproteobacteria bacterium]|nr:HEAT repeat domain-containing protein [Deltaproteobacteria bacterium]MCB9490333.1 HEAT repeat domain-containing protein [Deltaproteobacteria bacterium]
MIDIFADSPFVTPFGRLGRALAFACVLSVFGACAESKPFLQSEQEDWFRGDNEAETTANVEENLPTDIPSQLRLVVDGDQDERGAAARALGMAGDKARRALPMLVVMAEDEKEIESNRLDAIDAMRAIGPWHDEVVPALANLSAHPNPRIRRAAVKALAAYGPEAKGATASLGKSLRDPLTRSDAAAALSAIGKPATDTLLRATKDPDPGVRVAAEEALAGMHDADSYDDLIAGLRRPERHEASIKALAEHGIKAVPDLTKALESQDPTVKRGAAEALRRIGPEAMHAAPALAKLTNDIDPLVRASAQRALAAVALWDATTTRAVIWGLRDSDQRVRQAASTAMASVGKDAEPGAVDELVKALADHRWLVRAEAARALGRIGPDAAEKGQEPLVNNLTHSDARVRREAVIALGKFGDRTTDATREAIERRTTDSSPEVRLAADAALARIKDAAP